MPLITKKEYGDIIGVDVSDFSIYYKRGKIVYDTSEGKPLIDTANIINADFIHERCKKLNKANPYELNQFVVRDKLPKVKKNNSTKTISKVKEIQKVELPSRKSAAEIIPSRKDKISNLVTPIYNNPEKIIAQNEESKKAFETKRELQLIELEIAKKELEKRTIDVAKKEGELIPLDIVSQLVLIHSRSIVISFRAALERTIDIIGSRYKISNNEAVKMRKDIIEIINNATISASKETKSNISNLLKEFTDKK